MAVGSSFFPPSETLRIVSKENELMADLGAEALVLDIGSVEKKRDPKVVRLGVDASVGLDIIADAHRLPFRDKSFDLVICRFVLEYVYDPQKVTSELSRVLKEEGTIMWMFLFYSLIMIALWISGVLLFQGLKL